MTAALALQEVDTFPGNARSFATEGRIDFGDVGGYSPCGCCGGFHAIFEQGGGPMGLLNADDRGGFGTNGKVSLTTVGAGNQITRSNLAWTTTLGQPGTVTFAFRSTAPTTMPSDTVGFTRFTDAQITATLLALASWSEVANITFTRVDAGDGFSDGATMLFGNYASGSDGAAAFAYLPATRTDSSNSGDVWINNSLSYNAAPVLLGYGQQVLTHEIGHAIGLSHPAAYNAAPGQSLTYAANAGYFEDSRQYTVMSYFSESNTGASFGSGRYSSAPLMDDIAAAQRLYGANMTTRTADTTYGFNSNAVQAWFSATSSTSAVIFAVWDAGGTDTFDFSGYNNAQVIDLRQGSFSNVGALIGNVSIAIGAVIENAIGGSGADTMFGNSGDNVLTGGAGNDRIDGGLGTDTVVFSGNRSAYTITWNGQTATVVGPDGTDVISNVESLRFADQTIAAAFTGGLNVSGDILNNTMTGTASADTLNGLGGNDTLSGLAGNDTLDGGSGDDNILGGDGDDILIGGLGNDTLNGGNGFDTADYSGASGAVTVNLSLGTATGAAGADTLTGIEAIRGSSFSDVLTGSAGDDRIEGGAGADVLNGGAGNDFLIAGAGALAGGAPDVVKVRTLANASFATAVALDGAFDLLAAADITNSTTIPHATVNAIAHGGTEYYAFTVAAGQTILIDIDNGSFDSTLRLFGANGVEVATNDDANPDGGPATDSQISFTAATAGVYYVAVGQWAANSGNTFTSSAPPAGGTYTLHVSVPGHSVVPLVSVGSDLNGGAGSDIIQGGASVDTLVIDRATSSYFFERSGNGWRVYDGATDVDTVSGVELVRAGTAASVAIATAAASSFDAYRYMAAYSDLRAAFSSSAGDAYRHFITTGQAEGRSSTGFDSLRYLASNLDLVNVFGVDIRAGAEHYVRYGATEGRSSTSFSGLTYAASYVDLAKAFGTDAAAATRHYLQSGVFEGRAATFSGLTYAASYVDLAKAFGTNADAATRHYLQSGVYEGRSATLFDARLYAASHTDLAAAFGADSLAATNHYLQFGVLEGRATSGFDSVAYLLTYSDLAGMNSGGALTHWLRYGADENRVGDAAFGREQPNHALSASVAASASIEQAGDRDWFQLDIAGSQRVSINLAATGAGALASGSISIYNTLGQLLTTASLQAGQASVSISTTSPGSVYVVVNGMAGASGRYGVSVTSVASAPASEPEAAAHMSLQDAAIADAFLLQHFDVAQNHDTDAGFGFDAGHLGWPVSDVSHVPALIGLDGLDDFGALAWHGLQDHETGTSHAWMF
ncbi:M10 family metallopeptidase C-terminal domain-containing protein [Brevundimonas sp. TWP2-3-4b1]|uniref:M10 family metallopeptidase C-terminal domain-containing protein n=1 Tax=Brevundimonas sp. TWP2-3-4b1 TaxID=2804580 RepID=UPI003CE723E0